MLSTLEAIQLGFASFCSFVGACFQFVNTKNKEASKAQRLVSLAAATLLMVLLSALFLLVFRWNFWAVCILVFVMGIGAEIFLRLLMQYYSDSSKGGLLNFLKNMWTAYNVARNNDSTKQE